MELGFIYAISAAVVWGLVYNIDQKVLYTITPTVLLFINSIIAAIMLLPFVFFGGGSIKEVGFAIKSNSALIFFSIILTVLANFLVLSSVKDLNASTASIIEIAYPFFVVLFSYIIFRSTPSIYFFLGGILIFIGCSIIIKFT